MQLAVSFNNNGDITVMFDPAKLKKDEKVTVGYEPAPGDNYEMLDLPKELEGKLFREYAHLLRVNMIGATRKLEIKA
jgi:hypothetical protein